MKYIQSEVTGFQSKSVSGRITDAPTDVITLALFPVLPVIPLILLIVMYTPWLQYIGRNGHSHNILIVYPPRKILFIKDRARI